MSFGGSKSKSKSSASQDVWETQSPFLQNLWGAAEELMNGQQGRVSKFADLFSQEGLRGARGGMSQLTDIARTGGPLAQYANPNNKLAQQQLRHQAGAIGDEFQRVVMPALNSAAGVAGGLGGSRNQIARGLAASDAQSQIAKAGTDLYAQQYGIGAQAAAGATQARLDAAGGMGDMGSNIYNLGMSPFTAQWAPLTALAQILGNPTVLSKSKSKGSSKSASVGLF